MRRYPESVLGCVAIECVAGGESVDVEFTDTGSKRGVARLQRFELEHTGGEISLCAVRGVINQRKDFPSDAPNAKDPRLPGCRSDSETSLGSDARLVVA